MNINRNRVSILRYSVVVVSNLKYSQRQKQQIENQIGENAKHFQWTQQMVGLLFYSNVHIKIQNKPNILSIRFSYPIRRLDFDWFHPNGKCQRNRFDCLCRDCHLFDIIEPHISFLGVSLIFDWPDDNLSLLSDACMQTNQIIIMGMGHHHGFSANRFWFACHSQMFILHHLDTFFASFDWKWYFFDQ